MSISIGMAMMMLGSKKIEKEELDEVLKQHALWLADSKTGKRAALNGYDLSEMDLSGVNLSKADLSGTNLQDANLAGANLSNAKLRKTSLDGADLTDAILDNADLETASITHAKALRLKAEKANFTGCVLWETDFSEAKMAKACFMYAQLCDGEYRSADLKNCEFYLANVDYAHFDNADLESANLTWVENSYWATFKGANMKGTIIRGTALADDAVEGATDLFVPMLCPEEGAFIVWTKSKDGRLVKLQVPEDAKRTGGTWEDVRASKVIILDIFDGENHLEKATGLLGDEKEYTVGETVESDEFDSSLLHDGAGIGFRMSRKAAERIEYKTEEDGEDSEGEENE